MGSLSSTSSGRIKRHEELEATLKGLSWPEDLRQKVYELWIGLPCDSKNKKIIAETARVQIASLEQEIRLRQFGSGRYWPDRGQTLSELNKLQTLREVIEMAQEKDTVETLSWEEIEVGQTYLHASLLGKPMRVLAKSEEDKESIWILHEKNAMTVARDNLRRIPIEVGALVQMIEGDGVIYKVRHIHDKWAWIVGGFGGGGFVVELSNLGRCA